jgi:hypothetical protein
MVQDNTPVSPDPSPGNLNETIKGARPAGPYIDAPNEPIQSGHSGAALSCPFCGYPNSAGSVKCISCKKPLINSTADDDSGGIRKPDTSDHPNTNHPGRVKTKTPWSNKNTMRFSLKQLTIENQIKQTLDYDGDEVILNRANTMPANSTITSKQQAIIFNKDGKWFIVDQSSLQTTFIRPGSPVEIKKGDIILLGDSRFEFDL